LFGSLLGGLLESFSLWFGLRSLAILAAALYLLSAVFLRRVGTAANEVPRPNQSAPLEVLS